MKKFKKSFVAGLLSISIIGCAVYEAPEGKIEDRNSNIVNLRKGGFFTFTEKYTIAYIDRKNVRYGLDESQLSVSPGNHEIIVSSIYSNDKIEKCTCHAYISLYVNIQPQMTYKINGKVIDDRIEIWLEEAISGKIVSGKATEKYRGRYE